ncbi:MraY family glycosyltransferase [Pseudomonas sp. Au-Pse12]|uniref:MraY family glycosyltransferase n=1 Tax=Pseudomonas sp. Au-Pse12 TaxID=2906459 RepID=UPI001E365093|nr:glycosyltransferase family 4 protein [Pseudomonas sp. Au-Pse12]MCE4054030.1 glycosyltransferase family 4 protein [Pseudomonas sp. Au-Pse12]
MAIFLLMLVIAGVSLLLTWVLRRYALASSLMDVPNSRSSHSVPTPRGGGVAIVLSFLAFTPLMIFVAEVPLLSVVALWGAGALIAIVGFLDDHGHIAARWRLLAHFTAAIWALSWLGGLPPLNIFGFDLNLSWFGHICAVFYLVWMLNLYNFMDGIDGIASVQAVSTCLGVCVIYWFADAPSLIWLPLLLSMAVLGFLYWNFPPARIFMGDAGSGFLGLVLGVLSVQGAWASSRFLWVWLILLGVFIVDATFTLIRRLLRGDKVYEAHRSHAYQFASRQFGRHLPVTLAVLGINILWLLPIAVCVGLLGLDGIIGLILAYAPLVFLAFRFHAGELEKTS